jgi:hypothetical protein
MQKIYLLFTVVILLFTSCNNHTIVEIPSEVTNGILRYKVTLGEFNYVFSTDKKQMNLAISNCKILDDSDNEMTEIFLSGLAFHVFSALNNEQKKEFNSIKISSKSTIGEVEKTYQFNELAAVLQYDLATYKYFDFVVQKQIGMMYSLMDDEVRFDVGFDEFERIMLGAFEDSQMLSVELAGYNFLADQSRSVLHIRYVLRYENGYNRRHSLYFLTDDNNFFIDGFQL